jgi:hypothetical protein
MAEGSHFAATAERVDWWSLDPGLAHERGSPHLR